MPPIQPCRVQDRLAADRIADAMNVCGVGGDDDFRVPRT
jgi:hypothetical protein